MTTEKKEDWLDKKMIIINLSLLTQYLVILNSHNQ